ncbi:MAG TPA: histidine kinase [Candidatus Obscuribacterales bacterium]
MSAIECSLLILLTGLVLLSWVAGRECRQRLDGLSQDIEMLAGKVDALAEGLDKAKVRSHLADLAIGEDLSCLSIQLDVASRLRSARPEKAMEALQHARLITHKSLNEVRARYGKTDTIDFGVVDPM